MGTTAIPVDTVIGECKVAGYKPAESLTQLGIHGM